MYIWTYFFNVTWKHLSWCFIWTLSVSVLCNLFYIYIYIYIALCQIFIQWMLSFLFLTNVCLYTPPYLSLSRYGVLKHEVRALCDILTDIVSLGREQEVLVGIIGKRWGRCGGHWLVTGIPTPVATGWTAVTGWQHLFPNPVGWLWNCSGRDTADNFCFIFEDERMWTGM